MGVRPLSVERGYRFVAPVRELTAERAGLIVGKATEAQLVIEEEAVVEAQPDLAIAAEAAVAPRQWQWRKIPGLLTRRQMDCLYVGGRLVFVEGAD